VRIPGMKRVLHFSSWLDGRIRGRLLVLGYHRVASTSDDPFNLAVDPRNFEAQVEVLAHRAHVLPLRDAVSRAVHGKLPPAAVALTFDDGYADVHTTAAPMLERHGLPFTVFVTTGNLGGEFWWDELARLVRAAGTGPHAHGDPRSDVSRANSPAHRGSADFAALIHRLQHECSAMPSNERESLLTNLRGVAPISYAIRNPAMEPWQIQSLRASGLAEIGAHTVTHPRLTALSTAEREEEIRGSKREIEEIIGEAIMSFSYPHGDLSLETIGAVHEAGFRFGCASRAGLVRRGTEALACPRLWTGDWAPERFDRWLDRWLPGRRS
jgi:peptidoglycan/xylan/chitin deacetylase (PgdA/CDA1 family)